VECATFREAISARLDGEDLPGERAAVDEHLARCPACRRWAHDAQRVTRLARLTPVAATAPEVTPPAGQTVPARRSRRWLIHGLRWALGAFGAAQFLLGVAQAAAAEPEGHLHSGVTPDHLSHESAAWNIAIGAGFTWIALRRTRPAGAIPILTAFVAVLTLLTAGDVWTGDVGSVRLAGHGFLLAGYGIVVALSRPGLDPGAPPPMRRGLPRQLRLGADDTDLAAAPPPPALRLVRGEAGTRTHTRNQTAA
jgi:predicted anti-sigma-YlaC factor YlaD